MEHPHLSLHHHYMQGKVGDMCVCVCVCALCILWMWCASGRVEGGHVCVCVGGGGGGGGLVGNPADRTAKVYEILSQSTLHI